MKKEIIQDKDKIIAIILRSGDFPEGLNFHNSNDDFVIVSTWNYPKGRKSSTHSHRIAERTTNLTQEMIYLKKGKVRAKFYSEDDKLLKEVILNEGDLIIILAGGHGFETLEDNTQVIEARNGPYLGIEKDKRNLDV